RPDPMVDINPQDAGDRGIGQGDRVNLSTKRNNIAVKANVTKTVPPGVVNMYHGYPELTVNTLIEPDYLDPVSGYPGFKALLCEVKKI
ncbi:MAG: molybdopterin oxidoreductase, partial [Deltaproteobacteria bacterium]|nr:molybdopterin oxidoreductase [Deltaproteobacteria bacterium]